MSAYLKEAEVTYRHLGECEVAEPHEYVYRYSWTHIPTGTVGSRRIAVLCGCVYRLLLHWTNEKWLYALP